MSVTINGTAKTARVVDIKQKNSNDTVPMIAIDVVDAFGNTWACQMWNDDPQQAQLLASVPNMRRQAIQGQIVGYSVRMRKFQDGSERPQANFVISNVSFPRE